METWVVMCTSSSTTDSVSRGRQQCITPRLAAALDKCKISDRNAVHLLTAAAEAFGADPTDIILNRTSIRERRQVLREERIREFREHFTFPEGSIFEVHWDGKLLPSLEWGHEKVDRLAIIITFDGKEQLMGVLETGGSGLEMAQAVHGTLIDWGIDSKVNAMCFDTTASNTGRKKGVCPRLEKILGRELLHLACRHHVFETVLRGVFEAMMGPNSSLDTPLFKRFKDSWSTIDRMKTDHGMIDEVVRDEVADVRDSVLDFVSLNLRGKQYRDDYKEFLELTALFLNAEYSAELTVRAPGAVHHARWMAKALYCLKIFLFRSQFKLTKAEVNRVREICIFLVGVYLKAWFQAPLTIQAPYHDFLFLQTIRNYRSTNEKISHAAVKKFCNHLWYLSPDLLLFSLFDPNVPLLIEKRMRDKLLTCREEEEREGSEELDDQLEDTDDSNEEVSRPEKRPRRLQLNCKDVDKVCKKNFAELISGYSLRFFKILNIDSEFLKEELDKWPENEAFQSICSQLKTLRVVNDVAERGIKLISEYNDVLCKDESQKQYLVQTVQMYRQQYPDARKSTVVKK